MEGINILGIDLGTTFSAIAIWNPQAEQAIVLPNREGDRLIPSIVAYDPHASLNQVEARPIVGKAAATRMIDQPDEVVYSIKRFIGQEFGDRLVQEDRKHATYSIEMDKQGQLCVRIGEVLHRPPEISAEILRSLKENAEEALGSRPVEKAIITVPAYFNDVQRRATKEAGERAGLYVPRIINEPTAAAVAFGLGADPQTVAVYDLGGGTFDISVLQIKRGRFQVIAVDGDPHLGGDDFDLAIVAWMRRMFEREHGIDLPIEADTKLRALLREKAEEVKITLSTGPESAISVPDLMVADGRSLDLTAILTRSKLDELIRPLIARSLEVCDRAFDKAREKVGDLRIDQVLLVGGQTRTLAVKAALADRYGWPLNDSIDPDTAVAQGAAAYGARLCGYLEGRLKLWDVTPLSLGTEVRGGRMETVIAANTRIPAQIETPHLFTTDKDQQPSVDFNIYEGERPRAGDNVYIGTLRIRLTPPRAAGDPRIKLTFTVDEDGILEVSARDIGTDAEPIKEKFDYAYERLTQQQVDDKVREAKIHRNEDEALARLSEQLEHLRNSVGIDRPPGDQTRRKLDEIEAAINAHDLAGAQKLLAELTVTWD